MQHQNAPNTINELIQSFQKAFEDYEYTKLDIILILQSCIDYVVRENEVNSYKIPHLKKENLRESNLPVSLKCLQGTMTIFHQNE